MLSNFLSLVETGQLTEVERVKLPLKRERRDAVPKAFQQGVVGRWLSTSRELRQGIWTHQARALEYVAAGKNVVVATGTASGKSLIFQAAAFWLLDQKPEATVLVFYPLKALVADQLISWKNIAIACGLSDEIVARLDGDVNPDERQRIIEKARIILATPDVVHAWLMAKLAQPAHKRFLAKLGLVIIDEAHVLDSVFGSNFAYFFRRLLTVSRFTQRSSDPHEVQVVAASATISNPESHLRDLTGLEFTGVAERDDGSPQHEREVIHIASALGDEAKIAEDVQRRLVTDSDQGSFITFVDSRQGVERLAIKTDMENKVRPYRSGYEAADRFEIERALRAGELRGVVSTSALELGINIRQEV